MIRLLLVIPTLDQSGAEKQLSLLAAGLPKDQYEVHVVVLTRGGHYEQILRDSIIPVTLLNKRWKFDPSTFWKLAKFIKQWKPDVIHSWLFAGNAYTRLVAKSKPDRPVIVSERCVDVWKSGWQFWMDKKLRSKTGHLLGNSQSVVEFYQDLGYPESKTSVIRNGIEPSKPSSISREQLIQEWNLPDDVKMIGYVGRLAKQKRIKELLWACQLQRQIDPRCYLILVGDGPEKTALQHYAGQVESKDYVRFVGHRSDAKELYPHFEAFWLASDFEGQSNSIMEAMAAGVPVIASDIPANRELVIPNETGYLVSLDDSVGRSQFTQKIFEDEELANRLSQNSKDRIKNEFSIDRMINEHDTLYQSMLKR